MGRVLERLALALIVVAAIGIVAAPAIPRVAPAAMTMGTMHELFDVGRYQDTGRCDFWVVDMSNPTQRIEREFDCGFYWDWSEKDGEHALVHEALLDHETGKTFQVPHMARGNLEEWYRVDPHMLTAGALRFVVSNASVDAGVLMPPPGARGKLVMGWVESGGARGAPERVVFPRELVETGEEVVQGIPTIRWESGFNRTLATWHGYEVHLSEAVEFNSDPRTAWILRMSRHVVVEMTPRQMALAFGLPEPPVIPGAPYANDPQPIMELRYRTVPTGTDVHAQQARFFQKLVTPIEKHHEIGVASAVALVAVGGALALARAFPRRDA